MRSAIDYSRESINRGTDFGGSVAMAGGCVPVHFEHCMVLRMLTGHFCHIGFHIILLVNRNVRGSSLGKVRNLVRDLSSICAPIANSAMMSKLTAHCQWVDETVWVRTGHAHPPSYAEAKKIKSLTLYTQGCLRAS